jgi:hypothetical protein
MNDKRIINGLKSIRRRFYGFATLLAIVSSVDYFFLSGKSTFFFMSVFMGSIIIGGTISSFIEGYESWEPRPLSLEKIGNPTPKNVS